LIAQLASFAFARACVAALGAQLQTLKAQILEFDRMIRPWHRSNEAGRRLDDMPGLLRWRSLWLLALLIQRLFDQGAISQPGSGLFEVR
jgi:hypothetical protein